MANQGTTRSETRNLGFVVGEHEPLLSTADQQALRELRAEAALETDAAKKQVMDLEVTVFGAQLAVEALVNQQAEEDIQTARGANLRGRQLAGENQAATQVAMVAGERIGWLASNGPVSVPVEHYGRQGSGFWFGSITDKHRVTKDVLLHLQKEGIADELMGRLTTATLPQFLADLRAGKGNLRPVSKGTRGMSRVDAAHSLDTEYPAYKLDVQGTNNRAIVILPGKREQDGRHEQVIILAALYDHEDQSKIVNALYAKKGKLR